MALKLLPEDLSDVPAHLADKYETQAGRFWDLFYRRNTTKFFKDRHYLHKEFPDLAAGAATLLEVGCGVGNTVFPLLELNPALRIFCCDFAPSAIELVRQNPLYESSGGAVHAFVADITADKLAAPVSEGGCGVPAGGCDLATMIFVLSAVHPRRMVAAILNVAQCLRPGTGRLLFRDYAEGDLAMERLAGGDRPKRLGPNFYVRGDGTRCYYFSQAEVLALFASAGFHCNSVLLHERTVVNHKRVIAMDRRWLQAIFTLREPRPPPVPLEVLLKQPPPHHQQQHHHELQPWQLAALPPAAPALLQQQPGLQQHQEGLQQHQQHNEGHRYNPHQEASGMDVDDVQPAIPSPAGVCGDGAFNALGAAELLAVPGPGPGPAMAPGLSGGSWLTGAAGRLASHLAAGPGQPSGRAQLPDSLDSADMLRAELSPSQHNHHNHHNHHHSRNPQRSQASSSPDQLQLAPKHDHQLAPPVPGVGTVGLGLAYVGSISSDGAMQLGGGGCGCRCGDEGVDVRTDRRQHGDRRRRMSSTEGDLEAAESGEAMDEGDGGKGRSLESQLEAEFFATIGRDSAEVVAEEVAAAGAAMSRIRLADVADVAAASLAAAAAAAEAFVGTSPPPSLSDSGVMFETSTSTSTVSCQKYGPQAHVSGSGQQQQQHVLLQQPQEVEVALAEGVSLRCLCRVSLPTGTAAVPPATLALARIFLASPRLMAGRCALQLGPARHPVPATGCTAREAPVAPAAVSAAAVLPAMAAVRCSARRVVVTDLVREGLAAAAGDLRRNAHRLVIERLRLAALDWTAGVNTGASSASNTSLSTTPGSSASGYTYVSGTVRQIRDVLQMHPTGYDIVYAADPLAEIAGGSVEGSKAGKVAAAAAHGLFQVAEQLLLPLLPHAQGVGASPSSRGSGGYGGAPVARLLLLCFPAAWAAAHGLGFAALAAVCGWELLAPEQLVELYGVHAAAVLAGGCAVMGFRHRKAMQ